MNVLSKSFRWLFFLVLLTQESQLCCTLLGTSHQEAYSFLCWTWRAQLFLYHWHNRIGRLSSTFHSCFVKVTSFIYLFSYLYKSIFVCQSSPFRPACYEDYSCKDLREILYFFFNKDWWCFERFRISFDYSMRWSGEDGCAEWGLGLLINLPFCTERP